MLCQTTINYILYFWPKCQEWNTAYRILALRIFFTWVPPYKFSSVHTPYSTPFRFLRSLWALTTHKYTYLPNVFYIIQKVAQHFLKNKNVLKVTWSTKSYSLLSKIQKRNQRLGPSIKVVSSHHVFLSTLLPVSSIFTK